MEEYGRSLTRHIADQIQELRRRQGLSLEELAAAAGMHRTSVGLIVRGARGMTIERAAALAQALGVSLSSLIAEGEKRAG